MLLGIEVVVEGETIVGEYVKARAATSVMAREAIHYSQDADISGQINDNI